MMVAERAERAPLNVPVVPVSFVTVVVERVEVPVTSNVPPTV